MEKLKGKALAALGLPPTEDDIRKHRKRKKIWDQLRSDLNRLNVILDNLKSKYNLHKYQIYFIRNWLMKRMIRSTLKRAQQVFDGTQNQPEEPEDRGPWGDYADNKRKIDEYVKYYHNDRTPKEVAKESCDYKAQIPKLEKEFSQKRRLLEQLEKDYETSKSMSNTERYMDMKRMIKRTFRATERSTDN